MMPTLEMEPVVDRVKSAIRDSKLSDLDVDVQAIADDIRAEMSKNQKTLSKKAKAVGRDLRDELAKVDADRLPLPDAVKDAVKDQLPRKRQWPGRLLLLVGIAGLVAGLVPDVRRRVRSAATSATAFVQGLMAREERVDPVAFPEADAIQINGDPWAQSSLSPLPEGLGADRDEMLAPGSDRTDYADAVR